MRTSIRFLFLLLFTASAYAQTLTRELWSSYAYEDMSDWIRRLPGLYPVDYGVAGAPLVFRPWGLYPWYVGASRDGIPWNRVCDGLYDSNLDSPDELKSISLTFLGSDPMATLVMQTRELPADTPLTEIGLREGYYGFGRVDFAHAQRFTPRMTVEGRGRLFWYDGLRFQISKSRFYNLSGKLRYAFSDTWLGSFEYGGANVDAQSPHILHPSQNVIIRPQVYSEREYGTLRLKREAEGSSLEFGAHARQDRETREELFEMREQFWYGYAEGELRNSKGHVQARVAADRSRFSFPGETDGGEDAVSFSTNAAYDLDYGSFAGRGLYRHGVGPETKSDVGEKVNDKSIAASMSSASVSGLRLVSDGALCQKVIPQFWLNAQYPIANRRLMVDDAFATGSYFAGRWQGFESSNDFSYDLITWAGGIRWERGPSFAQLNWRVVGGGGNRFLALSDTVYTYSDDSDDGLLQGPTLDADAKLTSFLRFQSMSSVLCDKNGLSRAVDTRSFSRFIFSHDYFKAPLHIDSYAAYELIGRHDAVSDFGRATLGPAHLVHFRIEGTIEGVTLVWGVENLTGQHYEYLPGYMLIRKEEYFGLKWTLKL